MADPAPSRDGMGALADEITRLRARIGELEKSTGTQRAQAVATLQAAVDYLASLVTYFAQGSNFNTGTVADDDTFHWFESTPDSCEITGMEIPTGKCLIAATVGEASVQPGGSSVVATISFELYDGGGNLIPGTASSGTADHHARLFTTAQMGASLNTPDYLAEFDPVEYPGPYRAVMKFGMWVSSANTSACSTQFNYPSLRVQVIGDGVPA